MGHFVCEEVFYVLVEYRFYVLVEYRCHFIHVLHGVDPFVDRTPVGLRHA
jgi:pyrrolidone-carboxylate peptidase